MLDRCDVAIEYGHSILLPGGGYDDAESLQMSADLARDLMATLTSADLTVTTQVLVDDKRVPAGEVLGERLAKFSAECQVTLTADCIVLESRLQRLVAPFISDVLVPSARQRLAAKFESYLARTGALACSHDIALWHMLRFGLMDASVLSAPDDAVPAVDGVVRPCRLAVSILPAHTEEYEELADRDILVWNRFINVDHQILRFFFSDLGSGLGAAEPDWVEFKSRVIEIAHRSGRRAWPERPAQPRPSAES